jgi:hypothetical protein
LGKHDKFLPLTEFMSDPHIPSKSTRRFFVMIRGNMDFTVNWVRTVVGELSFRQEIFQSEVDRMEEMTTTELRDDSF